MPARSQSFETALTRRALMGAVAGTAALAAVRVPFARAADDDAWDIDEAPAPVPDDQIAETVEADVVVVGAGSAGLVCAVSAAEAGKTVVVIAKDDAPSGQGGSHFAMNSSLCRELGVEYDLSEALAHELQINGYRVSSEQWSRFANESGAAMDGYCELMARGGLACTLEVPSYNCGGATQEYCGSHVFYGGPNDSPFGDLPDELSVLVSELTQVHGQELRLNTRARQLVRGDGGKGRVEAVVASNEDGDYVKFVGRDAVVLATGDYGNDPKMLERYCPQAVGLPSMKYPDTNTGDGHKMALWVGAAMQRNPQHAAMLFGAMDLYRALMVNEAGERYSNERISNAFNGLQMAMQPGKHAFSVWDGAYASRVKVQASRFGQDDPTPEETQATFDAGVEAGSIVRADTLEELAEKAGIPADALKATVERYNVLCEAGTDTDFYKAPEFLIPVSEPPFYAQEFSPSLLITCGGLDVDAQMRVLDTQGAPIEGLYALGATAGNFFANTYTTYFAGANLGRNICFGYGLGKLLGTL